jgi:hypothetical protein
VIAVDNVFLMLQWQMKRLATQMRPMPVVCWEPNTSNWSTLNGKQITFWSLKPSLELIEQLRKTDGLLSLFGPKGNTLEEIKRWLRNNDAVSIEQRVITQAKPWKEALTQWFNQTEFKVAIHFYTQLVESGRANAELAVKCWKRKEDVCMLDIKYAETSGKLFRQTANATYIQRDRQPEQLLMEGVITIDTVFHSKDAPHPSAKIYRGKITADDDVSIPFTYRGKPANFTEFIREQLALHGIANTIQSTDKLLHWVTAATPPERQTLAEAVGWDGKQYLLSKAKIRPGYQPKKHNKLLFQNDLPGITGLNKLSEAKTRLQTRQSHEYEASWAILACLLDQITSKARQTDPRPLLCTGQDAFRVYSILLAKLNCPVSKVHFRPRTKKIVEQPGQWNHRWPRRLQPGKLPGNDKELEQLITAVDSPYFAATCSLSSAYLLQSCGTFNSVWVRNSADDEHLHTFSAAAIVSHYLQNATKVGLGVTSVLQRLHELFSNGTDDILKAEKLISPRDSFSNIQRLLATAYVMERRLVPLREDMTGVQFAVDDVMNYVQKYHTAQLHLFELPSSVFAVSRDVLATYRPSL